MRDSFDDKKEEFTPKNMIRLLYRFYKENLYPMDPIPSFRHVLMWAIQSGDFDVNYSFFFNKQVSFASAEAAWRLRVDPQQYGLNWDVVSAAMVDIGTLPSERHKPGEWANDGYDTDEYDSLRVHVMNQREADNDARAEAMLNEDAARAADNPQRQPGVRGAVAVEAENARVPITGIMADLVGELNDAANDGDGAVASPLPVASPTPALPLTPTRQRDNTGDSLNTAELREPRRVRQRYADDDEDATMPGTVDPRVRR